MIVRLWTVHDPNPSTAVGRGSRESNPYPTKAGLVPMECLLTWPKDVRFPTIGESVNGRKVLGVEWWVPRGEAVEIVDVDLLRDQVTIVLEDGRMGPGWRQSGEFGGGRL